MKVRTVSEKLNELLVNLLQYIKFEVLRVRYSFSLPKSIRFETEIDKKNQTIFINATEYPGLYTIAPLNNEEEIVNQVNDAIFTYFEVPSYIAKKTINIYHPKNFNTQQPVEFVYPQGVALA